MSADELEDDAPTADQPEPSGQQLGSRLLESVAHDRGLLVQRLASDLVVCDDGQRRVAFRGLAGSLSGKVAHVLCGNPGWLRDQLARCGLPTVDTPVDAEPIEVVVVGGRALTAAPAADPAAEELAVRAVAALPGAGYGSVRLCAGPSGLAIDTVDPSLRTWTDPATGRPVAAAILDLEFA